MICQHVPVIHLVDMIPGKEHHNVGVPTVKIVEILIDGICCALIPSLRTSGQIGLKKLNATSHAVKVPRFANADVLIE